LNNAKKIFGKKLSFFGYLLNMKKVIKLTESDLMRIVKRVISEEFTTDMANSRKAQGTKRYQQVFNKLYKTNFPLDGNWTDKKFNDTMMRYIKDKGLTPYVCKKGDGFCNDDAEGEVTVYNKEDFEKLYAFVSQDLGGVSDQPKNVKMFQDWLDQYYPTWLKGGKLNKGRGYGTFGPNTKSAWEKYKSGYKEN